jgi:hypothetical protein
VKNHIVLLGLPSRGLELLASQLDVSHREAPEIRHACEGWPSEESEALSAELISSKLADCIDVKSRGAVLLVYTSPSEFLSRWLKRAVDAQLAPKDLDPVGREALEFWRAYHIAILEQYREHEDRSLLLNGDRTVDIEAFLAKMKQRFGDRSVPRRTPRTMPDNMAIDVTRASRLQIVDVVAPECLDLYAELESCAELMGREPEFEFTGPSIRQAQAGELLRLIAAHEQWEHVLAQARVHSVGEYTAQVKSLWEENERLLNQLRDIQQQLDSHHLITQKMEEELTASRVKETEEREDRKAETARFVKEREETQRRINQLDKRATMLEAEKSSIGNENDLLQLQLNQVREELEQYYARYQRAEQTGGETPKEPQGAHASLERESGKNGQDVEGSALVASTSLLRAAGVLLGVGSKRKRSVRQHAQLLRQSGYFDEAWYLQQYPEIAQSKCDPVEHYLTVGFAEGRNPGPNFDTSWYLGRYPDVAAAKMNPLLHYVQFGKGEGRQPMRYRT